MARSGRSGGSCLPRRCSVAARRPPLRDTAALRGQEARRSPPLVAGSSGARGPRSSPAPLACKADSGTALGPGPSGPTRGHSRPTLPLIVCGPLWRPANSLWYAALARPSVAGPFSALGAAGAAAPSAGAARRSRAPPGPPCHLPPNPRGRGGAPPPAAGGPPACSALRFRAASPRSCGLAAGFASGGGSSGGGFSPSRPPPGEAQGWFCCAPVPWAVVHSRCGKPCQGQAVPVPQGGPLDTASPIRYSLTKPL